MNPVRPASARSPKPFEPGSVPLPKPGWGGGKGVVPGKPPSIDGFEHLAPSRWKDSVVTEEQIDKMADRLYSDAKRRQKAATDAASRVSDECAVNSRWRTKKAASDVEAGFDRLFDDSKRWQKKNKVLPPRPVTGIVRYKAGAEPMLEPAPKLPEDERLSRLLKQYYKNGPIRAKNRKKLFDTYCAGLTDAEKKILGILDEPEMPSEDKLQELAEKELAEIERLKTEMEENLAENTKKMYEQGREYAQSQKEKDAKRDEEMRARLEAKFAEIKEFQEQLEASREEARQREREAMREQRRAYEEEQARIAAKHEEEAAKRLEERRAADRKRKEEEERRNAERDAMFASLAKSERDRAKKYKETLEAADGQRTSPMCIEIREFQAKADEIRKADTARRAEAKAKEIAEFREQSKAYREKLAAVEEKQRQAMEARLEEIRQNKLKMKAEAEAREQARIENAKKMRAEDRARKKAIEEKYANRTITA